MTARPLAFLAAVGTMACSSSTFTGGVYHGDHQTYQVGQLPADWLLSRSGDGDVTFSHERGGTIYSAHQCLGQIDDLSLDVLTNQLLIDIEITEQTRRSITIDGREAMRTHVLGELDGVPIQLDA